MKNAKCKMQNELLSEIPLAHHHKSLRRIWQTICTLQFSFFILQLPLTGVTYFSLPNSRLLALLCAKRIPPAALHCPMTSVTRFANNARGDVRYISMINN